MKTLVGFYYLNTILFIAFFSFPFIGCTKKITTINIEYNLSMVAEFNYKASDKIKSVHYYDGYIMFQQPHFFEEYNSINKNGEMVLEEIIAQRKMTYDYYIFQKDDKCGKKFESLKDSLGKVFFVDSISKFYLYSGIKFPSDDYATLSEIVKLDDGKQIMKFASKKINAPEDIDSAYFYFDPKLNDVKYSLSKELDSTQKMKLYKYSLISDSLYKNIKITGRKTGRPRELILEFSKVDINNYDEILSLFKRYKKEINYK